MKNRLTVLIVTLPLESPDAQSSLPLDRLLPTLSNLNLVQTPSAITPPTTVLNPSTVNPPSNSQPYSKYYYLI